MRSGRISPAVEIGNEPNAYGSHGFRELPWIAQGYEEEVSSYREAIDALTPGCRSPVRTCPARVSSRMGRGGGALAEARPADRTPLSAGVRADARAVDRNPAQRRDSRTRGALAYDLHVGGELHRIPFRLDEANSVSCGGVAGISDTFASALWAIGYITQTMAAGTAGINLQGNPTNCTGYTPVCAPDPAALASGSLRAEPDWYALLLTSALVGDRPLPTTLTEGSPNLVAASFAGPDHSLKVVLVDDEEPGASPLAVRLDVGAGLGSGRILRLTAPAQSATGGVLLGGRAVAANGSWSTSVPAESVSARTGILALELSPDSAALVTVSPPTAPVPRRHRRATRR